MKQLAISQIAELLAREEEAGSLIHELEQDKRKGVQALLVKWKKQKEQEKLLKDKFLAMTKYEQNLRNQGFKLIAGVDEVGRGPLAGPVVAAAVILPETFFLAGIDDSKKLTEKKREEYDEVIRRDALAVSIAVIDADEIDKINIYQATKKAMKTAIASLDPKPEAVLIDAVELEIPFRSESIIKGDAKSVSIAAASIVAKVARDRFMKEIAQEYPEYGFQKNMGYGTKDHLRALEKYGVTPFHRKTFSPVKELLQSNLFQKNS